MSEKPGKEDSKERINELEDEVQRLKAQLQDKEVQEADAGAVEAVRRDALTPDEEDEAEAEKLVPSRSRLIIWGILAGVLALGGVLLLTMMLSSGFDFLGKKVATSVYPDDPSGAPQPKTKTKAPPPKTKTPEDNNNVRFIPPGL